MLKWRSTSMNKAMDATRTGRPRPRGPLLLDAGRARRPLAGASCGGPGLGQGQRIEGQGRGGVRRAWRLRGLLRLSRPQPDRGAGATDRVGRGGGRRVACPAHFRSDPGPVLQARHGRVGNGRGHGRDAARAQHRHDGPGRVTGGPISRCSSSRPRARGSRARTRSPSSASSAAPRTPSSTKRCPSAASRTRSAPPS